MEYEITSKRKNPKAKNPNHTWIILLSLLNIKETRLHDHGFVLMTFYEDLQDALEIWES